MCDDIITTETRFVRKKISKRFRPCMVAICIVLSGELVNLRQFGFVISRDN